MSTYRMPEAVRQQKNAYSRAYYRALQRLARAHPEEFGLMLDDEKKAPERRQAAEREAWRER